jgi:IS1 family transposase
MNRLDVQKRARIIACLCEGVSVRATCRLTGADKKTVLRLLVEVGEACADYMDRAFVNLPCKRLQADEIWSFNAMKEKTAKAKGAARPAGVGDVWTWTVIDADTKLIPTWRVGGRDAGVAYDLMSDLARRLAGRVQLTTDGHKSYLSAVEDAFGGAIDYAQLVKLYGEAPESERRYSPAVCIGTERNVIEGRPDPEHISTSYVERHNLTIRMSMRRFTRLTNGFSRKLENHCHALALFLMFYNFCRIHQTLRVTPAMEAGVTDHVWDVEEIVALVQDEITLR